MVRASGVVTAATSLRNGAAVGIDFDAVEHAGVGFAGVQATELVECVFNAFFMSAVTEALISSVSILCIFKCLGLR